MNRDNVTRLLTYLEQLKAEGAEDKWVMKQFLADRDCHIPLSPCEITNWHCGTAGCLAGSWTIIDVKDGGEPPVITRDLITKFSDDFDLSDEERDYVVNGVWSPSGLDATLDEAIDYLRLCLKEDTMDVRLG